MSILNWFRKRRFDPTRNWPPARQSLPPLQLDPFRLGEISLGSPLDTARPFGRADRTLCHRYPDTFDLIYRQPPLTLAFENNLLAEIYILTGFGTLHAGKDDDPVTPVRIVGGAVWDGQTSTHAILNFLGNPGETQAFDDGEKWLIYFFGDNCLQLEFNSDDLLAVVNMFVND